MGIFSKDDQETTQTVGPPEFVTPHLQNIMSGAQSAYGTPLEFFPGQTFADASPALTRGLQMQEEAAGGAQSLVEPGLGMFRDTLSGQYLQPEFLMSMAQPGIDRVMRGVNVNQNLAGGRGSSMAAEAAARGAASELGSVINAERGRQMQAAGLLPTFVQGLSTPGAEMARVGGAQMALDQRQIDEDIARFNFAQNEPWDRLQRYAAAVGTAAPLAGETRVTRAPADNSGIGQLIGMAAGYALGGPVGASVGSSLGGSLFGSDTVSTPSGGYGAPTGSAPWWTG